MLTHLQLNNFRNHRALTLENLAPFVLLVGANGVGKTNILEALSLLAPGRGLRQTKFEEIISNNENGNCAAGWSVYAEAQGGINFATGHGIEVGTRGGQRILKCDGKIIKTQAAILQQLRVLWFTPQLEDLCLASSSIRRKYFDRLVYNFFITHATLINNYEKLVRTRQKILQESSWDELWLTGVESQIAELIAQIAQQRLQALDIVNEALTQAKQHFLRPTLQLNGIAEQSLASGKDANEVISIAVTKLRSNRLLDKLSKRTNFGTHKTDFMLINPIKKRRADQCSTGEQKAMLISLTLAQAHALKKISMASHSNARVLLLLDELFSHLDNQRQQQIVNELAELNAQVWISGTVAPQFKNDSCAQVVNLN